MLTVSWIDKISNERVLERAVTYKSDQNDYKASNITFWSYM